MAAIDPTTAAVDAVLAVARDGGDVAEFVAIVLATAAAELGSTEALLAARPGSWEAAAVRRLLTGTVGFDDEHLADYMRGTPTARPGGDIVHDCGNAAECFCGVPVDPDLSE